MSPSRGFQLFFCDFLSVDEKKKEKETQMRGLRERKDLASGANRSDPRRGSPSFPLVRRCIAFSSSHIFCQRLKREEGARGVENKKEGVWKQKKENKGDA